MEYRSYTKDPGILKIDKLKIVILYNPNGAMSSIMYVLDDFAGFGSFLVLFKHIFKNGLGNQKN